MKKKIIIFYISRHSGHYHAASAIEKGLLEISPDLEILKINALDYTNPILGKVINKAYLEIIKKKPEFWGNIYDNPNVLKKTKKAREALHRFNMTKVKKLLDKLSPDVVFCTQAFPCGMVADYKRSCGKDIPLIGVLTDHAPHSYWLFDEVDFYAVPSTETADVLVKKGVPPGKIRAYGIPVDPRFGNSLNSSEIRKDLGLEKNRPTVLIMGGSQGLGVMEEVSRSFLRDKEHSYQLLVVTGTNKKLYRRLKRLARKGHGNMQVLAFSDNIDELMAVSDVIVTKAGGLTTAEALVKHIPILIVKPIPGHERMNADYLVKSGTAIEINDYHMIHEKINELFDSENKLKQMKGKTEKLSRPRSALDVAKLAFTGH